MELTLPLARSSVGRRVSASSTDALHGPLMPLLLIVVAVALRGLYLFRYTFDTDEAQHLHVAWGWARGLVQYRDVFDNHAPLFHLLNAPLVRLVGEKPELLYWGRLGVLPLYLLALWLTYRIGLRLFDRRSGAWAAAIVALYPPFFTCSLEFRADDLWMVFWVAAVLVLLTGHATMRRGFLGGLLAGAAAAASIKTVLLAGTLGMAAVVVLMAGWWAGCDWVRPRHWLRYLAAVLAGGCVVCVALTGFLASIGALRPAFYCLVIHNQLPGSLSGAHKLIRAAMFAPACLLIAVIVWRVYGGGRFDSLAARRMVLAASAAAAYVGFGTLSPITDRQDYLPIDPLLAVALIPLILGLVDRIASRGWFPAGTWALACVAGVELLVLVIGVPLQDQTVGQRRRIANTLRLTAPGECVMDVKGEMVFRPRAYYYALEQVTRERLRRGMLIDDIPERLVATGTRVVTVDNQWFPPRAREFMRAHYIPVGDPRFRWPLGASGGPVRVPGQLLANETTARFQIIIPDEYVIVTPEGLAEGMLDGERVRGRGFLTSGFHTFVASRPSKGCALVCARAIDRGFSPFGKRRD